jgi:hypothetical protein
MFSLIKNETRQDICLIIKAAAARIIGDIQTDAEINLSSGKGMTYSLIYMFYTAIPSLSFITTIKEKSFKLTINKNCTGNHLKEKTHGCFHCCPAGK